MRLRNVVCAFRYGIKTSTQGLIFTARVQFKMATRPPKRFKSWKLRVRSVSTSGRKTTRKIALKTSNSSVSEFKSNSVPSSATEQVTRSEFDGNEVCDNIEQNISSNYQTRREKEYERWQEIRAALLDGRIEEEEFLSEEKCVHCGVAEVEIRCNECGHEKYFCESCANSTHDTCNYFHVLEKFKVFTQTPKYFSINEKDVSGD